MDDSKDEATACFAAIILPAVRWSDALDHLIAFRRSIKESHGVYSRLELHATDWLGGRGNVAPQTIMRSERAVNHVHLILVPGHADGLCDVLAETHRRYTWQVNQREGWTGHLWQSRFASFPMDEAHLHSCLRYVELNPVRAGLVTRPEDWRWSSARAHLGLAADGITDLAAGRDRVEDWRALLDAGLGAGEHDAIRARERSGRALGNVPGEKWGQLAIGMGTVASNCPLSG